MSDAQSLLELPPGDWKEALGAEFQMPYMKELHSFLAKEDAEGALVYPSKANIFRALELVSLADVRVVILGQDPYHGDGQAEGLSFSVPRGIAIPPSLRNIYKELQEDVGISCPSHGHLESWARQGVLLLNCTLTVRGGAARSHAGCGWERFTDAVLRGVAARRKPTVYLMWGKDAEKKVARCRVLCGPEALFLSSAHPSPLSAYRGFLGSRPFSKTNEFLMRHDLPPIDWMPR